MPGTSTPQFNEHNSLTLWTIYHNERAYPGLFVVRRFIQPMGIPGYKDLLYEGRPWLITSDLTLARRSIPVTCVNIGRQPDDDKAVLEVWV